MDKYYAIKQLEHMASSYYMAAYRSLLKEIIEALRPAEPAPPQGTESAIELDFEFYWQIVIGWSQDMPRVGQKLSIHEMRTLTERLVSITAHALLARQPEPSAEDAQLGDIIAWQDDEEPYEKWFICKVDADMLGRITGDFALRYKLLEKKSTKGGCYETCIERLAQARNALHEEE